MRLIDADTLWMVTEGDHQYYEKFEIENAPTVDAVPIEDYKSMERTVNKLTKALADAEPARHGHWIEANDISSSPFDTMKRCLCSECRKWGVVTNYCPYCGAKMDEVEDDTVRTV